MDLAGKISATLRKEEDEKNADATLLDISTKILKLKTEMMDLKLTFTHGLTEIEDSQKEIAKLRMSKEILVSQETKLKNKLSELVKELIIEEDNLDSMQELVWLNADQFCQKATDLLYHSRYEENSTTDIPFADQEKLEHNIALQGKMEALKLYENFQRSRISNLEKIKINIVPIKLKEKE